MKTIYPIAGMALLSLQGMAQSQPNVLIIQCDHLTQRVVGAYGQTQGVTPTIDRIASRGVVFNKAYVGCPLSQPSRTALWTGLMPHQTNVRSNSGTMVNAPLPEDVPTLGSLFSGAGYDAVHFGKTHDMGSLRGFRHKEPVPEAFEDPEFPVNNDSFLDVGTCKDAVSYLSHPPKKPFICIVDFQNPHNICGYVGANAGAHTDKPISSPLPELPDNFEVTDWSSLSIPVQYICCNHRRMAQAAPWNETNYRHYIAAFQHYTRLVDKQIGQVIEALNATPAGKNTIIVLMADHGDGMGSHRMVTKQVSFFDEVTNVPFIFAGPGIKPRKEHVDNVLTTPTLDLLPTLCDFAGIGVPKGKPGISIAPVLKGRKQVVTHPYVASEWHTEYEEIITPGRMIRSDRYKYIHYLEGASEELYDLAKDPGEQHNLAKDPAHAQTLAKHRGLLDHYIATTGDDYRSLKVEAEACWRSHTPGYPGHGNLPFAKPSSRSGSASPQPQPDTLVPLPERVDVQGDTARTHQIIDNQWVGVGTDKPYTIQRDYSKLFKGEPSYRFELRNSDNTLEGYAEGETKGRAELSYCYATTVDFSNQPAQTYTDAQKARLIYHYGKGYCPQASSRDYEFSIFIPNELNSDVSTIFAQWHGMPDRRLASTPEGKVKMLTMKEFLELYDRMIFKKDTGYDKAVKLDKNGKPTKDKHGNTVYTTGKANGWMIEQGGYPPLAFGFSGGWFYIKANSDRKWLTDKTDRCNASPEKAGIMKPVTSDFKASTIAYKMPFDKFPKECWVTFRVHIDWTTYSGQTEKILKPGKLNVQMMYTRKGEEVKQTLVDNQEILIGRNDEDGYYFKFGIYRVGNSTVPVRYNLAGYSEE